MKYFLIVLLNLFSLSVFSQKDENAQVAKFISKAMDEQAECWNRGDLTGFMKHYWNSDSLRFIGKEGVTYGWQKTLDNYIKSYPGKDAMGKLTLNNLSIEFTDLRTVLVIGKWKLERNEELKNLDGHYSLLWQKKNGTWVIILDHSS